MKRIMLFCLFTVTIIGVYAENIEPYINIGYLNTHTEYADGTYDIHALGLNLMLFETKSNPGLYADLGVYFPFSFTSNNSAGTMVNRGVLDEDILAFINDGSFGFCYLLDLYVLDLQFSLFLHEYSCLMMTKLGYYYFNSDGENLMISNMALGAGGSVCAMIKLSEWVKLELNVKIAYDFISPIEMFYGYAENGVFPHFITQQRILSWSGHLGLKIPV